MSPKGFHIEHVAVISRCTLGFVNKDLVFVSFEKHQTFHSKVFTYATNTRLPWQ